MKCTNRGITLIIALVMASMLSGCKTDDIWMPFSDYSERLYFDGGFSVEVLYEDGLKKTEIIYQNDKEQRRREFEY